MTDLRHRSPVPEKKPRSQHPSRERRDKHPPLDRRRHGEWRRKNIQLNDSHGTPEEEEEDWRRYEREKEGLRGQVERRRRIGSDRVRLDFESRLESESGGRAAACGCAEGGEEVAGEVRCRGHRSRAGELKANDGGGSSSRGQSEAGCGCAEAEGGKRIRVRDLGGGGGGLRPRGLYMARGGGGVGVGRWAKRGRWPGGRAGHRAVPLAVPCPCRVMGQACGPCTARASVPCRHGHGGSRAVRPMGRAKRPCRVPCHRPMGRLAIYTSITKKNIII